jgi:Glu/Leu/Phe/Val dehydrogenase, dimerisation domain
MLKSSHKFLRNYKFRPFVLSNHSTVTAVEKKGSNEEPDFLEMVQQFFNDASKFTNIPKSYLEIIKNARAAVRFNFPLVRDDGKLEVITAYRVQHSQHMMPTKGGTRLAENIGT